MRFSEEIAMRTLLAVMVATAGLAAQRDQAPVFRSGVEVLEVDVTVVSSEGVPVRDLRAPDFTVTVDGQPRRVVSAELISDTAAPGAPPPAVRDPYVSNNSDRRPGRLLMLAIDRNNIDTATIRRSVPALKRFVSSLSPDDRVALVTIPPPGPTVDFTTNRDQVLDAIGQIIGTDDTMRLGRFNISNYEAISFENFSDTVTTQRLLFRACGDTDATTLSDCDRDVQQEAMAIAAHIRQTTNESVSSFAGLLKNLRDVEGAKSLVVLSQGLMLENSQADASSLALLASEARVTVNVLMYDVAIGDASQARISETISQDRDLRQNGLEAFASRSRGTLFRVTANPEIIFDRLRREISAYYMLGVEPTEKDRDGKVHQIRVDVGRKGVQVRARRQVQYAVRSPNNWSRDVLMTRVLRSPAVNTELPMRLSHYVFRDDAPGKVKLVLAAEIDPQSMQKDLDLGMGFAVFDRTGNSVASGQERKIYSANSEVPVRYDLTVAVTPGRYRVRLAAIDIEGNSGSVERDVEAFSMEGQAVAFGDLLLAPARELKTGDLRPSVIVKVNDGQLGTYTEIYTDKPGMLDNTDVVFEVADNADSPTLQKGIVQVRERADRTLRQAIGVVPVAALPPGRYMARVMVTSAGKIVGKLTRPFDVLPRTAVPAAGAASATGVDNPAEPAAAAYTSAVAIAAKPSAFRREDALKPETLRGTFDVMDKIHPGAKAALARARTGKLDGSAMMALDAGDQAAAAMLRGIELLSKGQLDPAANQFGVALRNAPDLPLASFYLGVCYAAAGRDKEAVAAWERARSARLQLPGLPVILAEGWLRLGRAADALDPLSQAIEEQPQNDDLRKNLAITQSFLGLHEQAYPTIKPFLEKHPDDVDALMVALQALYQVHSEGKTLGSAEEDKRQAAAYAAAYAAANGPMQALVAKWAEFLSR
jgi:VWFA-related protein